jgi:hypothetical protein
VCWVADPLGHADPALTLRVYAHAIQDEESDRTDFWLLRRKLCTFNPPSPVSLFTASSLTHLSVLSRSRGSATAHEGGGTNLRALGGLRRCSQALWPYGSHDRSRPLRALSFLLRAIDYPSWLDEP